MQGKIADPKYGLRSVLFIFTLTIGCLLMVPLMVSSEEPQRKSQVTLISDYHFFDVTSMSLDEVDAYLYSSNQHLREWYIGEATAAEHITRVADKIGVSPRVILLIFETQTSLFENNSVQTRHKAEQILDQFIEALVEATKINGHLPNWLEPGDEIKLANGTVRLSNFATALLYSLYPDLALSTDFAEKWNERFSGVDPLAIEPERVSGETSTVSVADTFIFPMGSIPASGYLVTQEFNVYYSYYGKYHAAEDWTAIGYGTAGHSVYAIANGIVVNRKFDGYPGGNVLIRHQLPNGTLIYSHYGHVTPTVEIGQEVKKGQKIATIWPWITDDGKDNAHLHFEIRASANGYGGTWTGAGYTPDDARKYSYLDPTGFIVRNSYSLPAVVRVVNYTTAVHQSPSTSAYVVANLSIGQERTVIERQVNSRAGTGLAYDDTDGSIWYKILYDPADPSKVGWALGVEFFKGSYWASRFFLTEVSGGGCCNSGPTVAWDFRKGAEGWYIGRNLTGPTQSAEGVLYTVTGSDPYLYSPTFSVPASEKRYVFVKMASQTDNCGQVYFKRQVDAGFAEERHVALPIVADGGTKVMILDMSTNPHWSGTITNLRLDPACNAVNNRAIRIDAVGLLSNVISWDFRNGMQGWFVGGGLSNQSQEAQGIRFSVSANDPTMYSPWVNINAETYPILRLEMASQTDNCGQLYFRRSFEMSDHDSRKVDLPIIADGVVHVYEIDMRANPNWSGNVVQLRLDPACSAVNNKTLRIDKVSFLAPNPPTFTPTPSPTVTPTRTVTPTPTNTATPTTTPTKTITPTPTSSPSSTIPPSLTPTATPSTTPTATREPGLAAPLVFGIANDDHDGNYNVQWTSVPGGVNYHLQEQFFGLEWYTVYEGPDTYFNLSGKTAGYWCYRVRATNHATNSSWSSVTCTFVIGNGNQQRVLFPVALNHKQ